MVGIAAFAAIAFIWQRLSGRPMLELFRATLSQRRWQRQLPFEDQSHGLAEWDRHARAEPGEAAWACYRGTVGLVARVHGPGGGSGRPRRRVATRVSILSGIEKKYDLCECVNVCFSVGYRPRLRGGICQVIKVPSRTGR